MSKGEKRTILAISVLVAAGAVLVTQRWMGMRFSGLLLMGIAVLLLAGMVLNRWANRSQIGKWLQRIFRGSCLAVLVVLAAFEAQILMAGTQDLSAIRADAVVVLGAGVNGTQPSLSLRTRLDAALDYLEENPDIPVVLTGSQGYGEAITEAQCMYNYLTERGVAPERLILEEDAVNTAQNFSFSRPLLEEAGIDPAEDPVAVVTNDFHIYRARLLAARQDYGRVFGIPARLPWLHLEINYYIREAFALVKTLIFDWR